MWYKKASSSRTYSRTIYQDQYLDIDRYGSDAYLVTISMKRDVTGYSVGALVNANMIGVASYMEYWHFNDDEERLAKKTFVECKKRLNALRAKIEEEKIPPACIRPMCRAVMQDLDLPHREKHGIFHVNARLHTDSAGDWRETIYGNHYPAPSRIDNQGPNVKFNSDESSKEIQVEGPNKRDQIF